MAGDSVGQEPQVAQSRPLRSGWSRMLRLTAGSVLVLGVAGGLAYTSLPYWAPGAVASVIHQQLGRQAHIEGIHLSLWDGQLSVQGLSILAADGKTADLTLPQLHVRWRTADLWQGVIHLEQVQLDGLHVHWSRSAHQAHNWDDVLRKLQARPKSEGTTSWQVDHLQLHESSISVQDAFLPKSHRVKLQFDIHQLSNLATQDQPTRIAADIRLGQNTWQLEAQGQVLQAHPHLKGQLRWQVAAIRPWLDELPKELQALVQAQPVEFKQGQWSSEVQFVWRQQGEAAHAHHQLEFQAELGLDKLNIAWAGKAIPLRRFKVGLAPVVLQVRQSTPTLPKAWPLVVKSEWDDQGRADFTGTVAPATPDASSEVRGQVSLQHWNAVWLNDWLPPSVPVRLLSAYLTAEGRWQQQGPQQQYQGSVHLQQVAVGNPQNTDSPSPAALRWDELSASDLSFTSQPMAVNLPEVVWRGLNARVIVDANGHLNWREMLGSDAREPVSTVPVPVDATIATAPVAARTPLPVTLGRLRLEDAQVNFTDRFIRPSYHMDIQKLSGVVQGVAPDDNAIARVELQGQVDDSARLTVNGQFNPYRHERYADIRARLQGLELTHLSAYAVRHTGYGIEKGKLSAHINYQIQQGKLQGDNHVFLDQLTFSDTLLNPEAGTLPVRLAVAILKNSEGQIDLNVPVSGSLNDPQFSVKEVVYQAVFNVLRKAVTAPFSFLSSLFAHDHQELSWMEFASGSSELTSLSRQRLSQLGKLLRERPGLRLDVQGRVDPVLDVASLSTVKAGSKTEAVETPEMGEALLALGHARAEAVMRWLKDQEHIDPARVFLLLPKVGDEQADSAKSVHRVDLILHD